MPEEVAKFLAAAKDKNLSRNPERDYTMPECPHEYAVRSPENEQEYVRMFEAVGQHGVYLSAGAAANANTGTRATASNTG